MMGPQAYLTMQSNPPMSLAAIPTSLILMNMVSGIIGFFLTQWIVSPLYISISRSVVLGEPFDRVLCKRLTEERTVRVAKLLWTIFIVMIPFYLVIFSIFLLINPQTIQEMGPPNLALISAIGITLLAYMIFFVYINLRIYYLVPAFASDRKFSSISEIWDHSKGQAWSVFKVILLGFVLMIGIMILFFVGILLLSGIMSMISQLAIAGKLALQIVVGIMFALLILFILAVIILIIPQLITAAVASVYKLSQSKA